MGTAIQDRVAELNAIIQEKQDRANEIIASDGITVEGKNVHVPTEVKDALVKLNDECSEAQFLIKCAEMGKSVTEMKGFMGEAAQQSLAMSVAAGAGVDMGTEQIKSLGEMFTGSDEFKSLIRSRGLTMPESYELDMADVTRYGTFDKKDLFTSVLTGAINPRGFGRVQFDPMVPRPQRATRVRDLFNVATTSANLIDFFRVIGFAENNGEGNAQAVAERTNADGSLPADGTATNVFGAKPKSSLVFQSAQAPVRTIAHWEAAHRNVLADEPQLQATINNELLYGLALEEDFQIIQGDGQNENLLGLLNQPYTQDYTQPGNSGNTAPGEPKSDSLRRAATKAIIANYAPNGYVLHPYDWEELELQKDAEGRYMLITNVTVGADSRIWRQPVVETPAMPQGIFATGAWGIGAQLYDRMLANVRIAEQHADFFVRNAVAILVEERLALAFKRPEAFVIGKFWVAP